MALTYSTACPLHKLHSMARVGKPFLSWLLVCAAVVQANAASRPHILFIVADDYGWNDIGFRNPNMITANLDRLAREGVILNQSYVLPVCTPSRSAFMTGMYPFKVGTQHDTFAPDQPVCVPLKYTMLPQELKKLGYATHAIGKWHIGYCNWNCTPTYRGFDTYFGYYNGAEDYYTHIVDNYFDYRDYNLPAKNYSGIYSTFTFAQKAVDIIHSHDPLVPLFMYLPFQAVHAPIEVPEQYEKMYPNVVNEGRRKYCGMVTALDEGIGKIVEALKQRGLYDDTIILFTGDNGPEVQFFGTCYPLRGGKHTLFEGGTRANAFMHGWGLEKPGTVYDYMLHAVDWLPTLVAAAGGQPPEGLDGMNQWEQIKSGTPSQRTELVYNLDNFEFPNNGHAAIRMGPYKLIEGYPGAYDGWYEPMNTSRDTPLMKTVYVPGDTFPLYLFDVESDPTEHVDLSGSRPDLVASLRDRIEFYRRQMVPATYPGPDPKSDPRKFGNVWTPGWC